jgi:zona occludens toxin
MSIYAYVGLPGSGKSYNVVANVIKPALEQGRVVVTNVPLHMPKILERWPSADVREFPIDAVKLNPGEFGDHAKAGCVLVLDELWKLFPAGQKVDRVPDPWKSLLAEHRHMVDEAGNSMSIVFVCQDLAQIGAFARQLVEQTFVHTKLGHLGMSGSFRVDVYPGGRAGLQPVPSQRIREIFGKYRKEIFELYQSHTMSESGKSGANEKHVDGRANIWRRPMIYVAGLAVVLAFFWGVPAAIKAFHDPGGKATAASGASRRALTAPGDALVASSTRPAGYAARPAWRVAGTMLRHDGTGRALLTDGAVSVSVPFEKYCVRLVGEWVSCEWLGEEVTPWSAAVVRLPLPEAVVKDSGS